MKLNMHVIPNKENVNSEPYDIAFENDAITWKVYHIVWQLVTLHPMKLKECSFKYFGM